MTNLAQDLRKVFLLVFAGAAVFGTLAVANAEVADKVIAVVNDEVLTQREFDRVYEPIKQNYEANFKGDELANRIESTKKGLLDQLVNSKLAISLAKKDKVQVDEKEFQDRIEKIKKFYGSEQEFLAALGEKGTNLTEFSKEIKEQMMAQGIVEKEVAQKIVVNPGEISELYEKNKEKLISPKKVKLSEIMTRKAAAGGDNAEAVKKINDLLAKAQKGEDFSTLATQFSEGPYAAKGGDMGYINEGQLLPEMEKTVFATAKGGVTPVIETEVGYHIFLVGDVQEAKKLTLEETSDFLREQLFKHKFEQDLGKWLEEKKKNAYISYK